MRSRLFLVVAWLVLAAIIGCKSRSSKDAFPSKDESLLADFHTEEPPLTHAYDNLFLYFLEGFESHRTPTGSMATFPGLPSRHGAITDGMEGFTRMAPMWGAWVSSSRPAVVTLSEGETVDLKDIFAKGVLSGTNPRSPGYWGTIPYFDNQRIVEASDIALSLWLFRDTVWRQFTPAEKNQVSSWLYQVNGKHTPDNNWHLFITFINVVLDKLGCPADLTLAMQNYQKVKQFYRGDGWFSDGPGNVFDYYNAWGIHYQLYWLQQVAPEWDPDFVTSARRQFVASYQYLVSVTGVPILGRSVCYRMAAVAPLVFGASETNEDVTPGIGRRALDVTWTYFIRNGALRNGNITQGYCGPDARILDNYSGPASCLWGLRSLIVAFYKAPDSPFWRGPAGKLPIETQDIAISIPANGWRVIGTRTSGEVEIDIPGGTNGITLQTYGWWRNLASALLWRPFRPDNAAAKYRSDKYKSTPSFCGCLK